MNVKLMEDGKLEITYRVVYNIDIFHIFDCLGSDETGFSTSIPAEKLPTVRNHVLFCKI